MLLLDVDGVMSDGGIVYTDDRTETKHFHVRDGAGLKIWQHCGKQAAIISGRTSAVVDIRAAELGIKPVLQGSWEKLPGYRRLLEEHQLQPEQVCFVADDVIDLPILQNCGLAVAVGDSSPEVRRVAHYVTRSPGGCGAVREVIELILRCQDHWPKVMRRFSGE
jgi:3-deoxy-D-manno-octulosonate 8-phosphate phosphatase (KDO 8-P phosphatase)